MVNSKKNDAAALIALQDLLSKGREFTFNGMDRTDLFNYFDQLHFLPYLIMSQEDETIFFEEYLKEICIQYKCMDVWNRYVKYNQMD